MSALAMMLFQDPSLLSFQGRMQDSMILSPCDLLFVVHGMHPACLLFQPVFPFLGIIFLAGIIAAPAARLKERKTSTAALMAGLDGYFIAIGLDTWNESQNRPDCYHRQVFI
jgi:hypothetical protein